MTEFDSSYFDVLGVRADSTDDDVKLAYRRMALKYHPDLKSSRDRRFAELKFRAINEAYTHLKTAERRVAYHRTLNAGNDNKRESITFMTFLSRLLRSRKNEAAS